MQSSRDSGKMKTSRTDVPPVPVANFSLGSPRLKSARNCMTFWQNWSDVQEVFAVVHLFTHVPPGPGGAGTQSGSSTVQAVVQSGIAQLITDDKDFWKNDSQDPNNAGKISLLLQTGIKVKAPRHQTFRPQSLRGDGADCRVREAPDRPRPE